MTRRPSLPRTFAIILGTVAVFGAIATTCVKLELERRRFKHDKETALPAAPHTHSLLGMNAREDGFYPLSRVWRVGRTKMENRKAGSGCGGCRLPRLSRRWR